jgi:hypothetical protein
MILGSYNPDRGAQTYCPTCEKVVRVIEISLNMISRPYEFHFQCKECSNQYKMKIPAL